LADADGVKGLFSGNSVMRNEGPSWRFCRLAYHVPVSPPEGGLTRNSQIMCEQEKSQSIDRFLSRRGVVSNQTLKRVQEFVGVLIDR